MMNEVLSHVTRRCSPLKTFPLTFGLQLFAAAISKPKMCFSFPTKHEKKNNARVYTSLQNAAFERLKKIRDHMLRDVLLRVVAWDTSLRQCSIVFE